MSSAQFLNSFEDDLQQVERLLVEMGGLVERQIFDATAALHARDIDWANEIVKGDRAIDALENEVDEKIIRLIALRHPRGADLRFVIGAMKVSSSLERLGDYAKNMAKRTLVISQSPPVGSITLTLKRMSELVSQMLEDVLNAYVKRDVELADTVRSRDESVDQLYNSQFRELLTHMMESPKTITPGMHLHFIAKNLERMGDHITGIAEQVHFMVKGTMPEDQRPKSDNTAYEALSAPDETE